MTYDDWIKAAKDLDTAEIEKMLQGLDALMGWGLFVQEYKWTGIGSIRSILKHEAATREMLERAKKYA